MTTIERTTFLANGSLRESAGSERIMVVNPATEQVIGSIADCTAADVDVAVRAARDALHRSEWATTTAKDRAHYLRALADCIEERTQEIATLVTQQNGMPISTSLVSNGAKVVQSYRYFAQVAEDLVEETVRPTSNGYALLRWAPVGVAGLIAAWNGPQTLIAWKLGPALAAGCTAVIKPAPETTLDAYLLADAAKAAGIPDGVINFVTGGRQTGEALVDHPGVSKIAFTGSSAAGRQIAAACGSQLKRVTLELGGKSAAIVLDDVDVEQFRPFVVSACSPNSGQVCKALTRVLAPRRRYDEIIGVVADAMTGVRIGDPMDPTTAWGPLVSSRQRDRVEGYIKLGLEEGGRLVTGGRRHPDFARGYYVQPTVFADIDNSMRIAREEIFGPVVVVIPYEDEADAIAIANDSEYGLGGGVFTADPVHGAAVARQVQTGSIGVNFNTLPIEVPFGGVKHSGIGRELGPEAIYSYLELQSILGGSADNPLMPA